MPKKPAPQSKKLLLSYDRLAKNLRRLTPKRQEIVRPALADPRKYVLLNVRELAARLGTNPATMIRIVRALGFAGYKAFQQYLHDLSGVQATSLDKMTAGRKGARGAAKLVESSIEQNQKNLTALRNGLSPARVLALAKRIYTADRILLLGGDLASSLIAITEYHLSVAGIAAFTATTPGRVAHVVRIFNGNGSRGKRDLVIAMSFGRGLRQTVEGLQSARKSGAYCVGITDTYLSPIARFADECFIAPVETVSFAASYVAPMAFVDALCAAIAGLKSDRILSHLKQADQEQRRGFRWYQSDS